MATTLRVTELDFDAIKQNLKNYLSGQAQFTDYDFEGSGLSVLLDTLAYNTHYNSFYLNMAMNEIFIDSAVKRESIVSLSKMLNYIPKSRRAASATLSLVVNNVVGSPTSLIIDRYTAFNTSIAGTSYTFYNLEPVTILPSGTTYSYDNLEVYEGTFVVNKFTVGATPGPAEKFIIPNRNIDTNTIRVTIQDDPTSSTSTKFDLYAGDITLVTDDSTIYFLEQNSAGTYQIYFGDGLIGRKLVTGQTVTIEYLVTNGVAANISDKISQAFELSGSIEGYTDVSITVVEKSDGGEDEETLEEIRFNAPKAATSQNRLVTVKDYEAFLKRKYSYIETVSVWGGEENDPPAYGKVFLSVVTKPNQVLTTSRKNQIVADIKEKRTLALTPTFVDPDIFFINILDTVKYNPNITNDSSADIDAAVRAAIQTYFTQNITQFGDDFSASKLIAAIDNSKASILGNSMIPVVQKRLSPTLGVAFAQNFKISNKIESGSINSTTFFFSIQGEILPARIKDERLTDVIRFNGTYRRSSAVVTINTPVAPHGLAPGEKVTINFSGSAIDGDYVVNTTPTDKSFTVITREEGIDYGTVSITTDVRGVLRIVNPDNNRILNNNIGSVAYNSGVVVIDNLNVFGYSADQTDVRIYFRLTRDSEDIFAERNQILRLDTSSANEAVNRLGGITISTLTVPK
jgi:hypothetical protein